MEISRDITRLVAEFVTTTSDESIPEEAIARAKELFLDTIGVAIAGSMSEPGQIVHDLFKEYGGAPEATVIGLGSKMPAPSSALVNGTFAHADDFDDSTPTQWFHPSTTLVPSALAMGEKLGASGRQVIIAHLIGIEVARKLASAYVGRSLVLKGWSGTGIFGTLGASVVGARLLGLDQEQTECCLGIAADQASSMVFGHGTAVGPFSAGHAASCGLIAAQLAQRGFTAPRAALEGGRRKGFFGCFLGGEEYDASAMVDHLGDPWEVISPGSVIKAFPSCTANHPAIEATLRLVSQNNFSSKDVKYIECVTTSRAERALVYTHPSTGLEGKFSMRFPIAVGVLDGKVHPRQFTDSRVREPALVDMMEKVKVSYEANGTPEVPFPSTVTIHLKDGRSFTEHQEDAEGTPSRPMSMEKLAAKYRQCAVVVLKSSQVERSLEVLSSIEELDTMEELVIQLSRYPSSEASNLEPAGAKSG